MYLFIADEADQDGSRDFLVYCAVAFPFMNIGEIDKRVERIRDQCGFVIGDPLKFSIGTKPPQVTKDDHTRAKNAVLEMAYEQECSCICYVVPHDIAKGRPLEKRLQYAINTLLPQYDKFMRAKGASGAIALFDRTTDFQQSDYLTEVSRIGIEVRGQRKRLEHVTSISQTREGASNLNSVADIITGAFRHVVNEPQRDIVGRTLIKPLAKLIWGEKAQNGAKIVREYGVLIRPKNVEVSHYHADIEDFFSRLRDWANK